LNSDQAARWMEIIQAIERKAGEPPEVELLCDDGDCVKVKMTIKLR